MSTKIYEAYRMSFDTLEKIFIPAYRNHCLDTVSKYVKEFTEGLKPAYANAQLKAEHKRVNEIRKISYKKFLEDAIYYKVRFVLEEHQKLGKFDQGNLSCSCNIWLCKKMAYVIPYWDYFVSKSFVKPDGVEEYGYWNNTDRPKEISSQQWYARKKKWDEVCLNDWNAKRLVQEVIDLRNNVGVLDITTRIFPGDEKHFIAGMLR